MFAAIIFLIGSVALIGAAGSASASTPSELLPGQTLSNNAQLVSPDGQYRLVMQSDGNLVLYSGYAAQWATATNGPNRRLVMQSDGNLVVYAGQTAVWSTGTAGFAGSHLSVQNDGNIVIYGPSGWAWWSRYSGQRQPGCYGDYCSGRDPGATGCSDDAVTVAAKDLGWGELNLRWSPVCKTNWARIYVYPTKSLGPGSVTALQSTGYSQTGGIVAILSLSAQSETAWSPMIYSPVKCVKAGAVLGVGYSWDYDWTACV